MNIFDLLKSEHDEVKGLFAALEMAEADWSEQKGLFQELQRKLLSHAEVEQKIFYEPLKQYELMEDLVSEAEGQHVEIKATLQELEGGALDRDEWMEQLADLRADVESHIMEEEGEMFEGARQILSREEQEAMASKFEQEKSMVMERI